MLIENIRKQGIKIGNKSQTHQQRKIFSINLIKFYKKILLFSLNRKKLKKTCTLVKNTKYFLQLIFPIFLFFEKKTIEKIKRTSLFKKNFFQLFRN